MFPSSFPGTEPGSRGARGPRGVVAGGHPETARAGAWAFEQGGNAVDAAVCAVLASFATESTLTGFGAGGFMLIHTPGDRDEAPEDHLIDFFVAAPGLDGIERRSELVAVPVSFGDAIQTFNVGAASCGVPGTPAGLELVSERYGTMPLSELVKPAVGLARDGHEVTAEQAYLYEVLDPILNSSPEAAAVYAVTGAMPREGESFRFPELADALELFGRDGAEPFYRGQIARRVSELVTGQGGTLGLKDFDSYEPLQRELVRAAFRGSEVLTNPPPSAGGCLIAYALGVIERLGDRAGLDHVVAATEAANALRGEELEAALAHEQIPAFLGEPRLDEAAARIEAGEWIGGTSRGAGGGGARVPGERLGSTTHVSALDSDGICASVTCSNGTGSAVLVPGTGVHVNNMLGEEDLNPLGFHQIPPGRRVSSMMAPTVALRDGTLILGLGSAGSNRIRSAILQTAIGVLERDLDAGEAVEAGRVHFEEGTLQAEPGVDPEELASLEQRGVPVVRWSRKNLYFGGAQAVACDPATGELSGGGDPRRGGAVVLAG